MDILRIDVYFAQTASEYGRNVNFGSRSADVYYLDVVVHGTGTVIFLNERVFRNIYGLSVNIDVYGCVSSRITNTERINFCFYEVCRKVENRDVSAVVEGLFSYREVVAVFSAFEYECSHTRAVIESICLNFRYPFGDGYLRKFSAVVECVFTDRIDTCGNTVLARKTLRRQNDGVFRRVYYDAVFYGIIGSAARHLESRQSRAAVEGIYVYACESRRQRYVNQCGACHKGVF